MPSETEKYGYLCGSIAKKRTQNEKNPPIYIFTHHCHPGNDCTHRHRHGTDSPLHCHTAQQNELRKILDQLQAAGINTVLLQTRVRGTVIYPSAYEPWDGCLSGHPGKSPGYDALQFAINECHRRGMELHAWIVTMPVGKWDALGCKQLRKKMPRNIIRIKADGYMNPDAAR